MRLRQLTYGEWCVDCAKMVRILPEASWFKKVAAGEAEPEFGPVIEFDDDLKPIEP